MRVTHVITRLVVGGAQENTVATVLGLRDKPGIDVHLISGPQTGPEGSLQSCFDACPDVLTIVPALVRPVAPWRDLLALLHLTKLFRHQQPDIVHTHSGKAGILGRMAARRARVPIIIHHIHGPSFGAFQNGLANWVFKSAERHAAPMTTHFVCSANAMTRIYLAAGIGHPDMYTRVFSGFRVESFVNTTNDLSLRVKLGLPEDAFVIGKVARLSPLKGHDDLFMAVRNIISQCPNARLLLVGDGPLRQAIERRAEALGLRDKVVFTGLVTPDEVPRFVGVMDCLVHLSTREGLPRALPQAMAARKPVISYDLYGANEVCFDRKTGFLVREGDIAAVSRNLVELAGGYALRETLGRAGQAFVQEHFRVERMVDAFHQVYLSLADRDRRTSARMAMPAANE
jgi:glycosyltransferase involved in cell wall biosynthesis